MYGVGKTEENSNAEGLAITIKKNFTDFVQKNEKHTDRNISCKIKLQGKHQYKSYKSKCLQVLMMMKQWRFLQRT